MKKYFLMLVLLLLVFYHIYPQALSVFGFSFIFGSGALGMLFFFYNGEPLDSPKKIIIAYLPIVAACIITGVISSYSDPYFVGDAKSEICWMFSAYLIVTLFFIIHKAGEFHLLLYYIIGAILLQCIITVAMYFNPAVNHFFTSLQMVDSLSQYKRSLTEESRLLGYGTAFFGSGVIAGFALILMGYILGSKRLNFTQLFIFSIVYVLIFYIGLLSARTTLIGAATSLVLIVLLFFFGKKTPYSQILKFLLIGSALLSIGYTLTYIYFRDFANWAFEAFINYQQTGTLHTQSSDAIAYMISWPTSLQAWLVGYGNMGYWGTDVGWTRLIFYFGLIGTAAFFWFQIQLLRFAITKNRSLNLMLLAIIIYCFILNVKSLTHLNHLDFILAFYFINYKYHILWPRQEREQRIKRLKYLKEKAEREANLYL